MDDKLDKVISVINALETFIPLGQRIFEDAMTLFASMTPNLSNPERIALLRQTGVTVEGKADEWLAKHPEN